MSAASFILLPLDCTMLIVVGIYLLWHLKEFFKLSGFQGKKMIYLEQTHSKCILFSVKLLYR